MSRTPEPVSPISVTSYAKDDGVRTLYKFMRYPGETAPQSNEVRLRVLNLLAHGELYFALPPELNDPFEAAPTFRPLVGTPEEKLANLSRSLREIYAPRWHWSQEKVDECEARLRREIADGTLEQKRIAAEAMWRATLSTEFPMCCLSAVRDSTLMWSYYAAGHAGLCVHFDATAAPFALAQRVVYSDEYPELPWPPDVPSAVARTILVLTKSRVWQHEQEYRVVNMPMRAGGGGATKRVFDDIFLWKTRQLMIVPAQLIVGVTVGAAMAGTEIEAISRACHDRRLRIPVFRARCHSQRYELQFEQIG